MRTVVFNGISGAFDKDFWSVDAVRAAQTYPSVWHAGLALTEMYRSLDDACTMHEKRRHHQLQAMEQYGRSIRSIIDIARRVDIGIADKEAVLLSNVLLIGFCCLKNDMSAAMTHIGGSLQIFYQWRFWDDSLNPSVRSAMLNTDSLVRLYRRFELQFTTSRRPSAGLTWKLQEATLKLPTGPFASTMDAYAEFLPLSLNFLTSVVNARPDGPEYGARPPHLHESRALFRSWRAKFTALLRSRYIQRRDEECILTLEIWSAAMEISLFMERPGESRFELAFDAWRRTFEKIADLAQQLYAVITQNRGAQPPSFIPRPFSSSMSVCEPLLFFWRFRDGAMRRKMIALLRKWPYQDGSWAPGLVACFIEQATLVEEEGFSTGSPDGLGCDCVAPQYICAMHRVIRLESQYIEPGKAVLWIVRQVDRQGHLAGEQCGREISISW